MRSLKLRSEIFTYFIAILITLCILLDSLNPGVVRAGLQLVSSTPRVNVPELTGDPFAPAIFWLGKVDQTNNYADVRVWYYDKYSIKFVMHIIDRQLWYDVTRNPSQLDSWDAVSIYVDIDGNSGSFPESNSYRFELQLVNDLRASYRGNGSDWVPIAIPISSHSEWRGIGGPNSGLDSEGWVAYFEIPFSSLGIPSAPSQGTIWGLGVTLHDRDTLNGSIFHETHWPETLTPDIPSTWGQLSFGPANYTRPRAISIGAITIRQGLDGYTVVDGEVGGHTTCGDGGYNKWTDWGNRNYAGVNQINIQNQWDISDWPCFSKYYITFPITAIPAGYVFISATLSMTLFGTAGGGEWGDPPISHIEVLTVNDDWNESTLTWNNAPLAVENISGTWVPPIAGDYQWNVSRAVDQAYNTGGPVRLAIYSIDSERHSGKYFYSSDSNDWNGVIQPTLHIVYGLPCESQGVTCHETYLPFSIKR